MSKLVEVDTTQLKELKMQIDTFAKAGGEEFINELLNEMAMRFIGKVKKLTPSDSGHLRRNWSIDNSGTTRHGLEHEIVVVNPTYYAEYVEYGHMQEPGRFVPKLGKKLKASWVQGIFMATKAEAELEKILPALVAKRLETRMGELFK